MHFIATHFQRAYCRQPPPPPSPHTLRQLRFVIPLPEIGVTITRHIATVTPFTGLRHCRHSHRLKTPAHEITHSAIVCRLLPRYTAIVNRYIVITYWRYYAARRYWRCRAPVIVAT